MLTIARGGNPDAQQSINNFLRFDSNIERTNLPNRRDVLTMVFSTYAGYTFFPELPNDPFTVFADYVALGFMAKGGEKSKQFVELMKQTPSITDLQAGQSERGLLDKMLGRGKENE